MEDASRLQKEAVQGTAGMVNEQSHQDLGELLRGVSVRRERESIYWDWIASQIPENKVAANVYKKQEIVGRLLRFCNWIDQKVLEVGVGPGIVAATLRMCVLSKWKYQATEMSPLYIERLKTNFDLDAVRTDVTNLPGDDKEFTRILCLDSLEHVHPDDRERGYQEISRVCAKRGLLFINMPLSEDQFHNQEFDHTFDLRDLHMLQQRRFNLKYYERYTPKGTFDDSFPPRPSAFVVMERV